MATYKPWESIVPMTSQPLPSSFNAMNNGFIPTVELIRTQGVAPPLPPRTSQQARPMSAYPPTSYPNTSYVQQPAYCNNYYSPSATVPMNNFTQLAMDESRSAFNSIESIIQTFHSISYMFESTFTNIYTSFRAMIDLFDHFTRLRSELSTLYPLVLIWRFLKFLSTRLLNIFHLRKSKSIEDSWTTIYNSLQQTTESTEVTTNSQSSSLLVALFFLVSFGTPMLMLKLLNSIIRKRRTNNTWLQQDTNQARVIALYDYVARNSDELSFTRGTTIYLAPSAFQSSTSHWFLGTIDRIRTGFIPANYVQPIRTTTTFPSQTPVNVNTDISSPRTSSIITNVLQPVVHGEEQAIPC